MIVSLTYSVADGAAFKSSQTYCLLDSKRSQIHLLRLSLVEHTWNYLRASMGVIFGKSC